MASISDVFVAVAPVVLAVIGLIKSYQADHKANDADAKASSAGTLAEKNKSHGQELKDTIGELFSFARSHDAQISDLSAKVGTAVAVVEAVRAGAAGPAPAATVTVNTGTTDAIEAATTPGAAQGKDNP